MSSSFAALGVPTRLAAVLDSQGIDSPFPIQTETLPDSLRGRDVLGRGRTGSGKTIAFALPLVARLSGAEAGGHRRAGRPVGLVLAPTRELATQIAAVIEPLATTAGLTVTTVFGGVSQQRQVAAFRAGVDIVVACPGRLEDLMRQGFVTLDAVQITVLDEADHMADLGFLPVVTRIMSATPAGGQRMLFSATLDNGVDKIVQRFLHSPATHSVDDANSPVADMSHEVFAVSSAEEKRKVVEELAAGSERRILFVRTKHVAKKLAKQLTAVGVPAADLQGNLSQAARDRNLAAFSAGDIRVLVATDVAARGVHVDDIALVIHVDPPLEHKAYLHRSGRTARAGATGTVVTITLPEQQSDVKSLLRRAAIDVKPTPVTSTSPEVTRLVGTRAAYVKPTAPVETYPDSARRQGRAEPRRTSGAPAQGRGRGSSQGAGSSRGTAPAAGSGRGTGSTGGSGRGTGGAGGAAGFSRGSAPRTGSTPRYSSGGPRRSGR